MAKKSEIYYKTIIIASSIFIIGVYKWSRKGVRREVILVDKTKDQFKIQKSALVESSKEPEIESKLIIAKESKKEVVREELIQTIPEKKPEELELSEEEVVSVQEEIIGKEQVLEEKIIPTEEIVEEEHLLEEKVVPPEESFEVEEEIVKDIIEVPRIEIISCQFCGMELSSDVIFCLRCGHKVKK